MKKLLEGVTRLNLTIFKELIGNHHLYQKTWNKVGGFSEEFSPGLGSDPDFNMKLWNIGVRLLRD